MSQKQVTLERLREVLSYDPETGIFTWRVRKSRPSMVGGVAGCFDKDGYILIGVDGVKYRAHRLAWLYVHGEWPKGEVDHLNFVRDDNRLKNMRDVSRRVNNQNVRRARSNNRSTGVLGVRKEKSTGKFTSQVKIDGRVVHLGTFNSIADAYDAYVRTKRRIHEGCTI